ncbi:MAG: flagellar M-ring protein FliF [Spirochaetaceae bacterium]|nr:flagellar M-ring protein FliF [Spirochaetaceae bacterium]
MKEQFKKIIEKLLGVWTKISLVQRIIIIAVMVVVSIAFIMLAAYSSSPGMVSVLSLPIKDENLLFKISVRMDEENISHQINSNGMIYVPNAITAKRVVSILAREDLIPKNASPWDVFKMERWTTTDFERNVNLHRAIAQSLRSHLEALDDIDSAKVILDLPKKEIFTEDQKKVSASIVITPKPGSDITKNKKKMEGIVKLVKFAISGLEEDSIKILDNEGNDLSDFSGLAEFDRLKKTKEELKIKSQQEGKYKNLIILSLKQIFGHDRVEILNIDIDIDFSEKEISTTEHFPVTMTPEDPTVPYSTREVVPSITISKEYVNEHFRGTGFNPEGPPGAEGQTPPAYKDLEGMVGEYKRNNVLENEAINVMQSTEKRMPWSIKRVTVGVAIDGLWKWEYDDTGNVKLNRDGSIVRNYTPVSDADIQKAKTLLEHAVGYNRIRGDSVTVQSLQFDRTKEHQLEDEKFRARMRARQIVTYSIIGLLALIAFFIIFRIILRAIERRRKLREEELARQHQAMREAALRSAEEDAVGVEISVEDRARLEMQEMAVNMAREHPEDVAQLIRTWLLEE